eukprot:TRINITY_DN43920_c0_g1_i1.p1 TRINITY_DN43920_c0_g1~~TRINITY_DN43920_c0_g1_i1.p1  ORF type:complete len:747 (+),score=139.54 TRINITY_DN43920_c0_g1_i1:148-2388(+)
MAAKSAISSLPNAGAGIPMDAEAAELWKSPETSPRAIDSDAEMVAGRRSPTSRTEWRLDEEDVRREFDAGISRLERARARVHAQTQVMDRISAKLVEFEPADRMEAELCGASMHVSRSVPGLQTTRGMTVDAGLEDHAMSMSDVIGQRRARQARFVHKRRELREQEIRSREALAERLEDEDQRTAVKLDGIMRDSQRRAAASALRRMEQQKACRELERERERVWLAYYAQHHQNEKSSLSPNAKPKRKMSSQRAKEPLVPPEIAANYVYQNISKSHELYAETIDQWRSSVSDNDRRSHIQWVKTIGPGYQSYLDELRGKPASAKLKSIGATLRATHAVRLSKNLVKGRQQQDGLQTGASQAASSGGMEDRSQSASAQSVRVAGEGESAECDGRLSPSATASGQSWEERHERCIERIAAQTRRDNDCAEKLAHNNAEAQRRKLETTAATVALAKDRRDTWEVRHEAAQRRKQEFEARSDAELVRKNEIVRQRLEEEARRQAKSIAQRSEEREAHHRRCLEKHQMTLEQTQEAALADLSRKHMQVVQFCQQQERDQADRAISRDFNEIAAERKARKEDIVADFRKKASDEIKGKRERSAKALQRTNTGSLQRQKEKRQLHGSTSRPLCNSLSLSDVGTVRDIATTHLPGFSGSDPADDANPAWHPGSSSFLPPLSASSQNHSLDLDVSPKGIRSSLSTRLSMEAMSTSPNGEDGSEEGEEILHDLETRSTKWLQDMRKKMEMEGPKRY